MCYHDREGVYVNNKKNDYAKTNWTNDGKQ
jgi:hypothetical protein